MTVFNLTKQDKFILFGETEEREVLGFCGKDTTIVFNTVAEAIVFNTVAEAIMQTKESNIFIVDTENNVHDIRNIDEF